MSAAFKVAGGLAALGSPWEALRKRFAKGAGGVGLLTQGGKMLVLLSLQFLAVLHGACPSQHLEFTLRVYYRSPIQFADVALKREKPVTQTPGRIQKVEVVPYTTTRAFLGTLEGDLLVGSCQGVWGTVAVCQVSATSTGTFTIRSLWMSCLFAACGGPVSC